MWVFMIKTRYFFPTVVVYFYVNILRSGMQDCCTVNQFRERVPTSLLDEAKGVVLGTGYGLLFIYLA